MNDIIHYHGIIIPNSYLFTSLAVVSTMIIANHFICREKDTRRKYNCAIIGLEYLFLILCAAVLCRPIVSVHKYCATPFKNYITLFTTNKSYLPMVIIEEVLMNIIMFIPVGILVAIYGKDKSTNVKSPLVVGLLISCSIEILQLLLCKGCCETNDIIHNTIGCVLGYAIYRVVYSYHHRHGFASTN